MHNLLFAPSVTIVYDKVFDNLFYREPDNQTYWKINHVVINNNVAQVERIETDIFGNIIGENSILDTDIKISSIYDLDQIFGGA